MRLRLGGFQKNTLIDFPGVVASLVFTQGCNFRCPYCHNPGLITLDQPCILTPFDRRDSLIDESGVFSFLKKREGLIDGVAITGGEPTLQPALEAFCFRLKNMGLKVKVDTNGSRPEVLEKLFRRELVDFVAMDIKSDQNGYQYLAGDLNCTHVANNAGVDTSDADQPFEFSRIIKSIKLIIEQSPAHEFRTTCVRPFITPEIMPQIGKMTKGASHYVLQHCSQNTSMLNPEFFEQLNHSSHQSPFFTDDELEELKELVEPYVIRCSIR
ncbi:MAG: anaerobic ribonucleoside-triphosphate reductase activating protein [Desulfamplus sp.]|nr:anaerobic ribonucleoside-triphosphate reductase activating protein [Desulfamplus sp.]